MRGGSLGDQNRPGRNLPVPVTRSKRAEQSSREPSTTGSEAPELESQCFDCVCGRSFSTVRGRNVHRGKMKCAWQADNSLDLESVSSSEEPGLVENHSARDIKALLAENISFEPPLNRSERIKWPAANDKLWEEFDLSVVGKLKEVQEGKTFQVRMNLHCKVVYDEGRELFGCVESIDGNRTIPSYANRRKTVIKGLVDERREIRKQLRRATTEMEKNGFQALLKVLAQKIGKLRAAERRREKQRTLRKQRGLFKKDPFRTIKGILNPEPVGELVCTREEIDKHLKQTYGDTERHVPLGILNGLPDEAPKPSHSFNMEMITWKEHTSIIKKARSKSAPGNNGIPYLVYKRCPGISKNLWNLNRTAFRNGFYPDNCRFFEGVYIPKENGNFTPETGRPISLGNVQGKIYLAVLAKRLTQYAIENGYVDLSVQKGGVPDVKGCIEHFGAVWEVIKEAKMNKKDVAIVWLDFANAYGAVPHVLIARALRFYNVPQKIIDIILLYFSGVFGRFSSKTVTSGWQKFEIGIFMGCVISVILFVLCMNLSDVYLRNRVPRAIQFMKDQTLIPLLRLFMDDSCLTCVKIKDMQTLLNIFQEFVKWARWKLKSSKSRALVLEEGNLVKWFVEEENELSLCLEGEIIPNVCEKPIKFLGRWIREILNDKAITEETRRNLEDYLDKLDKCDLTGLQKCWGYQYMVLPIMKWPLAIYEIPLSTVSLWEQKTNKYLRKWLGVGHTLSRLCLFSRESCVTLPIDSLQDTWKVEKCRLQQSYNNSSDKSLHALKPMVAAGRKWKPNDELRAAERDLECEATRGMIQPHFRAGIGFGEWKKPWEKMSSKEKNKEVISRVKKNTEHAAAVELGSLDMQCRWATWREDVLPMDMSWHRLFEMGDSMVGFVLKAVYGTLMTPALVSNWSEEEDGKCKLCDDATGTIKHILSGCKVALAQGRYTWRHDKVLKQISEQVMFHCTKRVNKQSNMSVENPKYINFIPIGGRSVTTDGNRVKHKDTFGILSGANDWTVLTDLGKQLKFPSEIATTRLRPDLVIFSRRCKRVVWWELTCPSEERIAEDHQIKLDRYCSLKVECESNGWSCYNLAVEVGARGMVADSLGKAASMIGIKGRKLKKLVRDTGREAAHCSRWIYVLSRKKEWESRVVGLPSTDTADGSLEAAP